MNRWIGTMGLPFALLPAMVSLALAQSGTRGWPTPIPTRASVTESYACDIEVDRVDFLFAVKKGAYANQPACSAARLARRTSTYDSQGNLTVGLFQSWETGAWVDAFRFVYVYERNTA